MDGGNSKKVSDFQNIKDPNMDDENYSPQHDNARFTANRVMDKPQKNNSKISSYENTQHISLYSGYNNRSEENSSNKMVLNDQEVFSRTDSMYINDKEGSSSSSAENDRGNSFFEQFHENKDISSDDEEFDIFNFKPKDRIGPVVAKGVNSVGSDSEDLGFNGRMFEHADDKQLFQDPVMHPYVDEEYTESTFQLSDFQDRSVRQEAAYTSFDPNDAPVAFDGTVHVGITQLDPLHQSVFRDYEMLNIVQSRCFESVYHTDENQVVSAPTGCGKTGIFELAQLRYFRYKIQKHTTKTVDPGSHKYTSVKAVYICPLKAQCEEQYGKWARKFHGLGIRVEIITGDTNDISINLEKADIIVTTPEKWDSMTRRWNANKNQHATMNNIGLLLVDEVHILGEKNRGANLEGTITRYKMIQQQHGRAYTNIGQVQCCGGCSKGTNNVTENTKYNPISNLRIVAVSATIPNIGDIGKYLNARVFVFDKKYRPVPLQQIVKGYMQPQDNSDYKFITNLGYRVFDVLDQYSSGRPALQFCCTRKDTVDTANRIAEAASIATNYSNVFYSKGFGSIFIQSKEQKERLWQASKLFEPKLANLQQSGVGVHSGGQTLPQRNAIEQLFLHGDQLAQCSTSTLSQGVNLPAHLVVIKGTKQYEKGQGFQEYAPAHITQMIGRAGRPQFDTVAKAVIMTSTAMRDDYEHLEDNPVISVFGDHLAEHQNAEIVLGTIRCQHELQQWLQNSFWYVMATVKSTLEPLVKEKLAWLMDHKLVEIRQDVSGQQCDCTYFRSTQLGEVISKHYLKTSTSETFVLARTVTSLDELLTLVSNCDEFQGMAIRMGEKGFLNDINRFAKVCQAQSKKSPSFFALLQSMQGVVSKEASDKQEKKHLAAQGVRYPLKKSQVSTVGEKVKLLLQCSLMDMFKLPKHELCMDIEVVKQGISRVCSAMFVYLHKVLSFNGMKYVTLLKKSCESKMWAVPPVAIGNQPVQTVFAPLLMQLDGIGPKYVKSLSDVGIYDFDDIHTYRHKLLDVKGQKDGYAKLQKALNCIPTLQVDIISNVELSKGWSEVKINILQTKLDYEPKGKYNQVYIQIGDYQQRLVNSSYWYLKPGLSKKELTVAVECGTVVDICVIDAHWVGADIDHVYKVPGEKAVEMSDVTNNSNNNVSSSVRKLKRKIEDKDEDEDIDTEEHDTSNMGSDIVEVTSVAVRSLEKVNQNLQEFEEVEEEIPEIDTSNYMIRYASTNNNTNDTNNDTNIHTSNIHTSNIHTNNTNMNSNTSSRPQRVSLYNRKPLRTTQVPANTFVTTESVAGIEPSTPNVFLPQNTSTLQVNRDINAPKSNKMQFASKVNHLNGPLHQYIAKNDQHSVPQHQFDDIPVHFGQDNEVNPFDSLDNNTSASKNHRYVPPPATPQYQLYQPQTVPYTPQQRQQQQLYIPKHQYTSSHPYNNAHSNNMYQPSYIPPPTPQYYHDQQAQTPVYPQYQLNGNITNNLNTVLHESIQRKKNQRELWVSNTTNDVASTPVQQKTVTGSLYGQVKKQQEEDRKHKLSRKKGMSVGLSMLNSMHQSMDNPVHISGNEDMLSTKKRDE